MSEIFIQHTIDRDIVRDVTEGEALVGLSNGLVKYLADTRAACPRSDECTASMICNTIDMTAWVNIGCIGKEGLHCPMTDRNQIESDVMDIIDAIGTAEK